jgi:hypothetical protein
MPISPEAGGTGSVGPSSPAGPERRFADVLAGKTSPSPGQIEFGRPVANRFNVPILDDGPVKIRGPNSVGGVERTHKVFGASRTLEVRGEKVGSAPGDLGVRPHEGGAIDWRRMGDDLFKAEAKVDRMIKLAQGGKAFNAQELMALQIEVFRYSQTVEVVSRTTDKLVGAVKQTLGTQV